MANPWAGEVEVRLDGVAHPAKLTLGALAELEAEVGGSVLALVRRFEANDFAMRDVLAVLLAGLRAAGWQGTAADLRQADLGVGALGAARIAAELLVRAFQVPGQE
ncbi:gene transfer agent family protein [Paenirhodobacter sp.]|uniref:gene transfer agent family protein n=1 Tax=Paenirhodobacter sp. TaxID=1965326 RepID=UPI003B3D047D